jgi:hypothetical protein
VVVVTARVRGEVLFARYAYPPNQLGYCGTGDGHELLDLAAGVAATSEAAAEVRSRAARFDGAWPYLELLAEASGVDDPLDPGVVEAYWLGGALLDRLDPARLVGEVRRRFAGQRGGDWDCLDQPGAGPTANHCFHVFVVYPWVRLLRTGRPGPALHVIDRCRIRWARVEGVDGDQLLVSCASLTWDGDRLALGPAGMETVRWSHDGRSLSPPPGPGAWVAAHWDWACDVLTGDQVDALRTETARQLAITNHRAVGVGATW